MEIGKMLTLDASKRLLYAPLIIGVALVLATAIGSYTFYKIRSFDNTLSVVGSAKQKVTSDQVKWNPSITRTVPLDSLQTGYVLMNRDLQAVKAFLKAKGVLDAEITVMPVFFDKDYGYNGQLPTTYTLRQAIVINSSDVNKITAIAKDTTALINQGVIFSTMSLEYYYSKLADVRVALLSDAIKDAKARASKLAESSGKSVGQLKSAASGVVQVLAPNSIEVSDYGTYDTQSIEKEIMVTVRAAFTLK
jgi:hypothetical protein